MEGNAAHRHPSLSAGILTGQRELQLMGRRYRVVIEKLIEIAQSVKEKAVLVLVLHLLVLFHQRRFRHVITPFFWFMFYGFIILAVQPPTITLAPSARQTYAP